MGDRKTLRLEDLTFIVDSREQKPLSFMFGPTQDRRPMPFVQRKLDTGDYSVVGFEKTDICVERKSLEDLLMCVGVQRERFEREVCRILAFKAKLIIVEAMWDDIQKGDYKYSKLEPSHVIGSIIGWMELGIPFFFHSDRKVLANFVGNFMYTHVRRFHQRAMHCHPSMFRIQNSR